MNPSSCYTEQNVLLEQEDIEEYIQKVKDLVRRLETQFNTLYQTVDTSQLWESIKKVSQTPLSIYLKQEVILNPILMTVIKDADLYQIYTLFNAEELVMAMDWKQWVFEDEDCIYFSRSDRESMEKSIPEMIQNGNVFLQTIPRPMEDGDLQTFVLLKTEAFKEDNGVGNVLSSLFSK